MDWTKDQLIVALNLYYKLGFTNVKYTHPKIIDLAKTIDRTPSAIAFKLVNFARLDPELQKRGVKGMSHGSKGEEPVWNEFYGDIERLAEVSEKLLARFRKKTLEESTGIDIYDIPKEGKERQAIITQRVNQNFFREMVLSLYKNKCCITGLGIPRLLIAGHIKPWSLDKENRMNPHNGIVLNALHDKAFEAGLITILTDYTIRLSSELKKKNDSLKSFFQKYEGQKIFLPPSRQPSKTLLEYHNDVRFLK